MNIVNAIEAMFVRPEAIQAQELARELRSLDGDASKSCMARELLDLAKNGNASSWIRTVLADATNHGEQYVHTATDRTYAVGAFMAKDGIVNRFWRVSDTLTGEIICNDYQPFGLAREALASLTANGLPELNWDVVARRGSTDICPTDLKFAKLLRDIQG